MRVLFDLHYPGYLRYYDSTVRLLAERGHTVLLAFGLPQKQREGLAALEGSSERIVVLDRLPRRDDIWRPVARGLRRTIDYARYLHPRFAEAPYLRRRMKEVPPAFRFLTRIGSVEPSRLRVALRGLLALERAIPSDPSLEAFIAQLAPDVVLVSPLVADVSQTDVVKSARALGIPAGVAVASWDHLTTKGLIRTEPDAVLVWNEAQRSEAAELHYVPSSKIVVTGAQPFDRWFERRPSTSREAFCRKVGLPPEMEFVMFAGSTASISAPDAERRFVRKWVEAMRESATPEIRGLAVLVRPHPYNSAHWDAAELADLDDVALWPRGGANPVDEGDRADYFDSMYHSVAVVGINTSAMIEAAIVGRPVHTIRAPEFSDTQGGTLHFQYLLPERGGFVRAASTLEEHLAQLAETVLDREAARAQTARFVASFVRPHGLDRPCTPIVVDAIERLGQAGAPPVERLPGHLYPVRAALLLLAAAVRCIETVGHLSAQPAAPSRA